MKCQRLFSGKKNKINISMLSADFFLPNMHRVKYTREYMRIFSKIVMFCCITLRKHAYSNI